MESSNRSLSSDKKKRGAGGLSKFFQVNEYSCVSTAQHSLLPFEVCVPTHSAISEDLPWTSPNEVAYLCCFTHNIRDVARKQQSRRQQCGSFLRESLNPALPVVQFEHQSNAIWTSIDTYITENRTRGGITETEPIFNHKKCWTYYTSTLCLPTLPVQSRAMFCIYSGCNSPQISLF